MRLITGLGLIILLSGCASITNSYQSTVGSWRGGNVASLTKRWGKPDIKVVGQSGNTFYIYRSKINRQEINTIASPQVGVNTTAYGHPVIVTTPPSNLSWGRSNTALYCSAAFEVNAQGHIVSAESKGSGCYGGADFEQRMRNPMN
jgi:hypothetical protein